MNIEKDQNSPGVLFIASVFDSEDIVEGSEGETVKDVVIQSYYNSELLKEKLGLESYNMIREKIGLK